jgi:hypothetical protein
MPAKVLLLVGTKKGLFLLASSDRRQWTSTGPFLRGKEVSHAIFDPRNGRIYATANDAWFGCEVTWSDNLGKTWHSAKQNPGFSADSGLKLERIWHIEPGHPRQPKLLYAGVAPAALFRSDDAGETWSEITGLTRHETRSRWHPGAGGLCLHSIVLDDGNPEHMWVAISAVGVFSTEDGGATWKTANRGTRAEFMPDKRPEFGQCVHKLLRSPGERTILFQQNHCGVYRSGNDGETWQEITKGLPSDFGFPLAVHPREPKTIYVIPLKGGEFRCPPKNKLRVWRSRNGGRTWQSLGKGLPAKDAFTGILREGMAMDTLTPAGVYFGTNTGKLYGSANEGDAWKLLADDLPPIYSVSAAVLETRKPAKKPAGRKGKVRKKHK